MDKVLYFAYGANRDIKMMQAITGSSELKGKPATLKGYSLYVQRLDQVPDTVSENSPAPISPRDLLKESWPDTFTSYIIKEDPEGEVDGVVWKLTPLQRELVRDWELVDFGWYGDINTEVTLEDGQNVKVQTEGLRPGQNVDRKVDGKDYETWLNDPSDFERVANKAREEYFERTELSPEGKVKPEDLGIPSKK